MPIDKNGILTFTTGSTIIKIYVKNVNKNDCLTILIKESTATVTNETELRQAILEGIDTIYIGNDIEIVETGGVLQINKPITLNGYKNPSENYSILGDITLGTGPSGAELQHINIKQNLDTGAFGKIIIDPGTNGIITLIKVITDGTIDIESSGYNSAYFYGITSPEINLNCNSRSVLDEYPETHTPCTVERFDINSISEVTPDGTIAEAPKLAFAKSIVDELNVSSESKGSQLTLGNGAEIDTLISYGNKSDFTVDSNGKFDNMNIYGEDTAIKVKDNGKIDYIYLKKAAERTHVDVDGGGQIREAYVDAEYTSFSGNGAAVIEVDPEVSNPPIIEGYSVSGNTATVSNSMGIYEALKNNIITIIKMNPNIYTLIDKHLELNKTLTIKTTDEAADKPILMGTITISSSSVTLDNLNIDAKETYSADISSSQNAISINPTGETSLTGINILNNTIQQDYKGITILNNASVVINNNIVSGNLYNNLFLYAQGICIKSSGTITIDEINYNISSQAEAENLGNSVLSNYPFNLKITLKNKYEKPISGIKHVLIDKN